MATLITLWHHLSSMINKSRLLLVNDGKESKFFEKCLYENCKLEMDFQNISKNSPNTKAYFIFQYLRLLKVLMINEKTSEFYEKLMFKA